MIELLINKIEENSISINQKSDDWKKNVSKEIEYIRFFNEEKNKWNKIIEKHKDNLSINRKKHDESCIEVIEDYNELTTGSRRW